jgi:hypothetical protein
MSNPLIQSMQRVHERRQLADAMIERIESNIENDPVLSQQFSSAAARHIEAQRLLLNALEQRRDAQLSIAADGRVDAMPAAGRGNNSHQKYGVSFYPERLP